MFALIKRFSCFEKHFDSAIEKFISHHRFLGFLLIFIGIPLITSAAVCLCTAIIAFPIAFVLGWI